MADGGRCRGDRQSGDERRKAACDKRRHRSARQTDADEKPAGRKRDRRRIGGCGGSTPAAQPLLAPGLFAGAAGRTGRAAGCRRSGRSEEHTSELQSLMRISYAVFCLKKKRTTNKQYTQATRMYQNLLTKPNM